MPLSRGKVGALVMLRSVGSDISSILNSQRPVLAVFYAGWCPFCRSFLPEFEAVKSEKFEVAEVDLSDWDNPLWESYKVDIVPTLIAFQGGKEIARKDGRSGIGLSKAELQEIKQKLEQH